MPNQYSTIVVPGSNPPQAMFNRSMITIPCHVFPNGNSGDAGSLRFMHDHSTVISTLFGSRDFHDPNFFKYDRFFNSFRDGEDINIYHFKSMCERIPRNLTVRDYGTRIIVHETVGDAYAGSSNTITVTNKKNIDNLVAWLIAARKQVETPL